MLNVMHVTKIHGNPEPSDVDQLEQELCVIATASKTPHFEQGLKFGHLAMILSEQKYRKVITNDLWTYNESTDPGAYDVTNIVNNQGNLTQIERSQLEQEHKRKQTSHEKSLGVARACREHIANSVDKEVLAPLWRQYIGYAEHDPQQMIAFLRDKACIPLTGIEKS